MWKIAVRKPPRCSSFITATWGSLCWTLAAGYVAGLEPATNFPNFKTFERQQGRVVLLPAGGHWETTWSIEVQDSAAGVAGVLAEIVSVQSQAKAVVHRVPHPKYSAAA